MLPEHHEEKEGLLSHTPKNVIDLDDPDGALNFEPEFEELSSDDEDDFWLGELSYLHSRDEG